MLFLTESELTTLRVVISLYTDAIPFFFYILQRHTLRFGITTATYYGSSSVNSNIELARVVGKQLMRFEGNL